MNTEWLRTLPDGVSITFTPAALADLLARAACEAALVDVPAAVGGARRK
jgi:hypothetical protein